MNKGKYKTGSFQKKKHKRPVSIYYFKKCSVSLVIREMQINTGFLKSYTELPLAACNIKISESKCLPFYV